MNWQSYESDQGEEFSGSCDTALIQNELDVKFAGYAANKGIMTIAFSIVLLAVSMFSLKDDLIKWVVVLTVLLLLAFNYVTMFFEEAVLYSLSELSKAPPSVAAKTGFKAVQFFSLAIIALILVFIVKKRLLDNATKK